MTSPDSFAVFYFEVVTAVPVYRNANANTYRHAHFGEHRARMKARPRTRRTCLRSASPLPTSVLSAGGTPKGNTSYKKCHPSVLTEIVRHSYEIYYDKP